MGKFIEHTSIYGTDLSDDENAESMMKIFMPSLKVYRRYIKNSPNSFMLIISRTHLKRKIVRWQLYTVFRIVSLFVQNQCVQATE